VSQDISDVASIKGSTHVQVKWEVCRVHGLSLSSSVTDPLLSFAPEDGVDGVCLCWIHLSSLSSGTHPEVHSLKTSTGFLVADWMPFLYQD